MDSLPTSKRDRGLDGPEDHVSQMKQGLCSDGRECGSYACFTFSPHRPGDAPLLCRAIQGASPHPRFPANLGNRLARVMTEHMKRKL